jgi:NAD+ synthase (glutamine-hydrolysing)
VQEGALQGLLTVAAATAGLKTLVFVGLPLRIDGQLFNCAAAVHDGRILGIIPKSFIPTYKEFNELKWFSPAANAVSNSVRIGDQEVPFGIDLLFSCSNVPDFVVGAEICEDLWVPIPPSTYQALAGATVLVNLSASNEIIGKAAYRRRLVSDHAARLVAAYAYVSSGVWESTTDIVFSGHCLISENGSKPVENARFEREAVVVKADIDVEKLIGDRLRMNSYGESVRTAGSAMPRFRRIAFTAAELPEPRRLLHVIDAHPFVPKDGAELGERCCDDFNIQVAGLAKRLVQVATPDLPLFNDAGFQYDPASLTDEQRRRIKVAIGVSGGLDSTLALVVTCKVFDLLGVPRKNILGFTLPGFGTTRRTKRNAIRLMEELGVTSRVVDIRKMCFEEMKAAGHKPFGIDISRRTLVQFERLLKELPDDAQDLHFENVQARMRTLILMQAGFVVGTGDLSEQAKGWCTFNADQMSMYNVNSSVPKTLIKFLVHWVAMNEFEGAVRAIMLDIVGTEISPELLPTGKHGEMKQKTEEAVGPYELTDFFIHQIVRFGFSPQKVLYLADHARFDVDYDQSTLRRWLRDFVLRFFRQQFKRTTMPDGPKTGSISFSPRGDWMVPTDACAALWLDWLSEQERQAR